MQEARDASAASLRPRREQATPGPEPDRPTDDHPVQVTVDLSEIVEVAERVENLIAQNPDSFGQFFEMFIRDADDLGLHELEFPQPRANTPEAWAFALGVAYGHLLNTRAAQQRGFTSRVSDQ